MPNDRLTVAAIQLSAGDRPSRNLEVAGELCRQAVARGAELVVLPELYLYRGPREGLHLVAREAAPAARRQAAELARDLQCWLVAGGIPIPAPRTGKLFNTTLVFSPAGDLVARYRKIHLFEVNLPGLPRVSESDDYLPGSAPVLTAIAGVPTGLAVCYDLRFPELFRVLVAAGAELGLVPANFTRRTGEAHWATLVRARAIENQMFVVAAAQAGEGNGLPSYGHSCILGPWGEMLASSGDEEEAVVVAELDFSYLRRVRMELPVLQHRRPLRGLRNRP